MQRLENIDTSDDLQNLKYWEQKNILVYQIKDRSFINPLHIALRLNQTKPRKRNGNAFNVGGASRINNMLAVLRSRLSPYGHLKLLQHIENPGKQCFFAWSGYIYNEDNVLRKLPDPRNLTV